MEAKDVMSLRSQQSQSKDDVLDLKTRVRGSLYMKPYLQSIEVGRLCLKADLYSVYVWNYLCSLVSQDVRTSGGRRPSETL
jgi:hypothetical protein